MLKQQQFISILEYDFFFFYVLKNIVMRSRNICLDCWSGEFRRRTVEEAKIFLGQLIQRGCDDRYSSASFVEENCILGWLPHTSLQVFHFKRRRLYIYCFKMLKCAEFFSLLRKWSFQPCEQIRIQTLHTVYRWLYTTHNLNEC